jgi:hypothetical protein
MGASCHLSCETDATSKVANTFRWTQQSHLGSGCYWNSLQTCWCIPTACIECSLWYHIFHATEYTHGISDRDEAEKSEQELSIKYEYTASPVGMAFSRTAMMETARNGHRNSGLWPADRAVCLRMLISLLSWSPIDLWQSNLERSTAEWIENFSLTVSSAHAAKPVTPTQTSTYNGYIAVEKISLPPWNSAGRPRPKSRQKLFICCGVNWDTTQEISE